MTVDYEKAMQRYELIRKYFMFGLVPDGAHVIIRCLGRTMFNEQYIIVDWPERLRWLSLEDAAIACSQGYMPFGYSSNGPIICIHMD